MYGQHVVFDPHETLLAVQGSGFVVRFGPPMVQTQGTPLSSAPRMGRGSHVHSRPLGTPDLVHSPPPRVQGMPTPFSLGVAGGQPGGRSIDRSMTVASLGGGGADEPGWQPKTSTTPSQASGISVSLMSHRLTLFARQLKVRPIRSV